MSLILSSPSDANCKQSLKALIHFYGLLPKKEAKMFEEFVINKLVSEIKSNKDLKNENEEVFAYFSTHK